MNTSQQASVRAAIPESGSEKNKETQARPSTTAWIVCAARGIGVSQDLRDPGARALSSGWVASALGVFEQPSTLGRALRRTLRTLSLGIVDHNTVRMALVDQYVRSWVASGCEQLVILGAGLDARAYRMQELGNVDVFEVDHGMSQSFKRARVSGLQPLCKSLTFVEADFNVHILSERLKAAGFDATRSTAWVCEGVTAYLEGSAISRLLHEVSALSAKGSKLALSYIAPKQAKGQALAARLAAKLGEPALGQTSGAAMAEMVRTANLGVVEDISWTDWLQRVPSYRPGPPNLLKERMLIAEKGISY